MNYHLFQKDRLTQSPTLISIIVPLRGINTGEINTNGPETTTNEFDTTLWYTTLRFRFFGFYPHLWCLTFLFLPHVGLYPTFVFQ